MSELVASLLSLHFFSDRVEIVFVFQRIKEKKKRNTVLLNLISCVIINHFHDSFCF